MLICKNEYLKSVSLLPLHIKSKNAIKKYPQITQLLGLYYDFFIALKFLNFSWNMFDSKTTKRYNLITIYIERYPMSSY